MTSATILTILSNPNVIDAIIGIGTFLFGVVTTFLYKKKEIGEGKEYSNFNLLVEIAKEEALKLAEVNITSEEKKVVAIKEIKKRIPEKIAPFISDAMIEQALVLAYQYYIKPTLNKKL